MLFEAVSVYSKINTCVYKRTEFIIAVGFEVFSFMNYSLETSHQKDIDHVMLDDCELKLESALIFFHFDLSTSI